jgi:hypothetical protein
MPSNVTTGPRGDFYMDWKYRDGSNQPYQKAGDSWDESGPAGKNYKTYNWKNAYYNVPTDYKNFNPPTNY